MKRWEKIYIICNIVVIIFIISIYTYRMVYYYKKMNVVVKDSSLVDILENKVVYSGDGLYKEDDNYYFKGKNVDNYVYYYGNLYRIVSVTNDGIKLISNDSVTSMVYGVNKVFSTSNIYKYLNDTFSKTIEGVKNSSWCNMNIDIDNYKCDEYIDGLIGLITTEEYLLSGGVNSYLNNGKYYWTINTSDNKAYYVHSKGGINNNVSEEDYYSYGVRPVFIIDRNIHNISGTGTSDDPYILTSNTMVDLGSHYVGSYVKINDKTFRILSIESDYVRLIYDGVLDKKTYSDSIKYINNKFISEYKDILTLGKCVISEYSVGTNYLLKETSTNSYACLPNALDLFILDYNNIWLNTKYNNNLMYTVSNDSLFADLTSNLNYVRPIINVKKDLIISGGKGTKSEPLVVGN